MSRDRKPPRTQSRQNARRAKPKVIDVFAWWNRTVWQYSYVEPCQRCGHTHLHGGGNGDQPDLAIGETGGWGSHCLNDSVQVELRLVRIIPRPEPASVGRWFDSPLDKGLILAREWRERTFYPCDICPPHPSGELRHHKTTNFHQKLSFECVVCPRKANGHPQRHFLSSTTKRRGKYREHFEASVGADMQAGQS
jgi:hypothetical protein